MASGPRGRPCRIRRAPPGPVGDPDGLAPGRVVVIPYQYVTLRVVPRVDREEFVNVGIVLFADAVNFLDAGCHVDARRLDALHPGLDLEAVTASLRVICEVCRGVTGRGLPDLPTPGRRFGWLAAPRSTVLQPGPRHGGLAADPAVELDVLMDRLVRPALPPKEA